MNIRTVLAAFSLSFAACSHPEPAPPGTVTTWSFDDTAAGMLPAGFRSDATRRADPIAKWEVRAIDDAPSGSHVLSLPRVEHNSGDTFNLCWTDDLVFLDGSLRVKLRDRSGREDSGGGLIWRARGRNNYYVARYNPLERNLRLYHVVAGLRTMIASADVDLQNAWYDLAVEHHGDHIQVALDGRVLLDVHDDTLPHPGGIGVWTKADAATDFDDLRVEHAGAKR